MNSLTEEEEPTECASEDEEEELDIPPPLPKLHTCKQAMESLEGVKVFLEHRGCLEQASTATFLLSELVTCYASTLTQSTLEPFIQQVLSINIVLKTVIKHKSEVV